MNLLILTQKVDRNDPILGFFHRWVEEFAKHCTTVIVLCLVEGEHNLPHNVRVLSLGKEQSRKRSDLKNSAPRSVLGERLRKLKYMWRFYKYIWTEQKNYDAVFVHMNPIYVALGSLLWRTLGKTIGLWYVHKSVDLKLRIAEKLTHRIFTASKESFRLPSKKLHIVGQGIDVGQFSCDKKKPIRGERPISILHVGRITPIKNIDTLIEAIALLNKRSISCIATLIGGPAVPSDVAHKKNLITLIQRHGIADRIIWQGNVPNTGLTRYYCESDISVNLTPTGGIDKVVLESMASGVPILTSNEAFADILGDDTNALIFQNARELAEKIVHVRDMPQGERNKLSGRLRHIIVEKHDIKALIPHILSFYATSK